MYRFVLVILLPLAPYVFAESAPPLPAADALQVIRADAIKAHMQFLADDLMEGRETGTRGYLLAANYVRSQFELLGLKPGGGDGTYFQQVPLRRTKLVPEKCSLSLTQNGKKTDFVYEQNFAMRANISYEDTSVEAPVVFVGYGISAPDFKHDDYAGLDVKGKIVAAIYGAPNTIPDSERAHFTPTDRKEKMAAEHGAVGFLMIWAGKREKETPFTRFVRFVKRPGLQWVSDDGKPAEADSRIRGDAYLSPDGARLLFTGASQSFDDVLAAQERGGDLPRLALPATVAIHQASQFESLKSPNVAAILPGSDPKLKNEYVLYTAHLDHLGIGRPVNGDSIYNGALDNASGSAAVLEVAHAFVTAPRPPRRSIMFVLVTGEEQGLIGSDYFANYPTVSIDQIAVNVNMDELPMVFDFKDVVPYGAEHSSLGPLIQTAAKSEGLEVSPDPLPEENFFVRSDQYSLVLKGVPAVSISGGEKAVDPNLDGGKLEREWIKTHYHSPQDDMSQPLDYNAAAKYTRLNYALGYALANMSSRPTWNPGDDFGKTYGQHRMSSAGQH